MAPGVVVGGVVSVQQEGLRLSDSHREANQFLHVHQRRRQERGCVRAVVCWLYFSERLALPSSENSVDTPDVRPSRSARQSAILASVSGSGRFLSVDRVEGGSLNNDVRNFVPRMAGSIFPAVTDAACADVGDATYACGGSRWVHRTMLPSQLAAS